MTDAPSTELFLLCAKKLDALVRGHSANEDLRPRTLVARCGWPGDMTRHPSDRSCRTLAALTPAWEDLRVTSGFRRGAGCVLACATLAAPLGSARADLGPEIVLSPRQAADASPHAQPQAVASAGTIRLAVWMRWTWVEPPGKSSALMAARIDSAGNVLDPAGILVATSSDPAADVTVSSDGVGFLIGWTEPSAHLVYARRLAADGTFPDGSAVVSATGRRAAQGWDGSRYRLLVATAVDLVDLRIAPSGVVTSSSTALSLPGVVSGSVGAPSLVAYSDGTKLWSLRIDDAGLPIDPLPGVVVADPVPPVTQISSVPVDGGHVVLWRAQGFVVPGSGGGGGSTLLSGAGGSFLASGGSGGSGSGSQPFNSGGSAGTYFDEAGMARVSSSGQVASYPLGSQGFGWESLSTRGSEASVLFCTTAGSTAVRLPAGAGPPQFLSSLPEPNGPCASAGDASGYVVASSAGHSPTRKVLYHLDPSFVRDEADVTAMRKTSSQSSLAAASSDSGYLVAWRDTALSHLCLADKDSRGSVMATRLDDCGNLLDPRPLLVSSRTGSDARSVAATFGGGVYAVTWQERFEDASGAVVRDRFARITPDGKVLDPNGVDLGPTISENAASLASDGSSFVMVGSTGLVQSRRFDAAGNVDPKTSVLASGSFHPAVTFDGASYVVSFDKPGMSKTQIQIVRLSPSGNSLDAKPITVTEGDWLVNGPSASDGLRTLVTWTNAPPGLGPPMAWQGRLVEKNGQPAAGGAWPLGHAGYQRANLVWANSFVWQPSLQAMANLVYDDLAATPLSTDLRRYASDGSTLDATPTSLPSLWSGTTTALAAGADSVLIAYAPILGDPDDAHRARARLVSWSTSPTCSADAGVPLAPDFEAPAGPIDCDAGAPFDAGADAGSGGTSDSGSDAGGAPGDAGLDAANVDAANADAANVDAAGGGTGASASSNPQYPELDARGGLACRAARTQSTGDALVLAAWGLLGFALARVRRRRRRAAGAERHAKNPRRGTSRTP